MKNRVYAKFLILFLIVFTGLSTAMPLVFCFDEDSHVQLEIAEIPGMEQSSKPLALHLDPCEESRDNVPDESDCGDCFDMPVFSGDFLNQKSRNIDSFVTAPPPLELTGTIASSNYQTVSPGIYTGVDSHPHPFSSFNITIEDVVLRI